MRARGIGDVFVVAEQSHLSHRCSPCDAMTDAMTDCTWLYSLSASPDPPSQGSIAKCVIVRHASWLRTHQRAAVVRAPRTHRSCSDGTGGSAQRQRKHPCALRAPAKPASALDPVALTQAFGSDAVWRLPCPPPRGCHVYFAQRVSFLSCVSRAKGAQRPDLALPAVISRSCQVTCSRPPAGWATQARNRETAQRRLSALWPSPRSDAGY